MIRRIDRSELAACLEIFHQGYETVAIEFGLTEENSPNRGRANLPMATLVAEFEAGTMMFGYFCNTTLVGFLGMKLQSDGICKLNDIIVLPEYRQLGYGTELLEFCRKKARELGSSKLRLGMIDDNVRLKKWYEKNGFSNIGYVQYEGAPYLVGRMECIL